MFDAFKRDMTELMKQLRTLPALCLWRSYAPSHFGGEHGTYLIGGPDSTASHPAMATCCLL